GEEGGASKGRVPVPSCRSRGLLRIVARPVGPLEGGVDRAPFAVQAFELAVACHRLHVELPLVVLPGVRQGGDDPGRGEVAAWRHRRADQGWGSAERRVGQWW